MHCVMLHFLLKSANSFSFKISHRIRSIFDVVVGDKINPQSALDKLTSCPPVKKLQSCGFGSAVWASSKDVPFHFSGICVAMITGGRRIDG